MSFAPLYCVILCKVVFICPTIRTSLHDSMSLVMRIVASCQQTSHFGLESQKNKFCAKYGNTHLNIAQTL